MTDFPAASQDRLRALECPQFESTPWAQGPPLAERRVAIVSTAGLIERGDRLHSLPSPDFRSIGDDAPEADVLMNHISVNFDRTGFMRDMNVAFPRARLHDLVADGTIGSVASRHYAFMGATDPVKMTDRAAEVIEAMHADEVDTVLLVPV
jgi:D-proline reductase (dithiol) PrdB